MLFENSIYDFNIVLWSRRDRTDFLPFRKGEEDVSSGKGLAKDFIKVVVARRQNKKPSNGTEPFLNPSQLRETGARLFNSSHERDDRTKSVGSTSKQELPDVLVSHISKIESLNAQDSETMDNSILQVYNERTCELLHRNQYSIEDIVTWSWILTSRSGNEAVQKLVLLNSNSTAQNVPFFLVNFVLQQQSISAENLHFLVEKVRTGLACNDDRQSMNNMRIILRPDDMPSTMLLFVRLVRHARRTWANGLSDIADILTLMLPVRSLQLRWQHDSDVKRYQLLTFHYNRALLLLSRPTHSNPFQHASIQQRALLQVLRAMTKFRPHIPVQREGFRALLSVQLAHKKTKSEKEWANLKALSWPPWKDEKSGLDADRGDLGSKSRALGVIRQMTEAGYTKKEIEQISTIYTGWDTDRSPTIQTRTSIPITLLERASMSNGTYSTSDVIHINSLWAARIATTRTLREAWSAFKNFEEEVSDHRQPPYLEMLTKLVHSRPDQPGPATTVLAGDSKETFPEPLSPRYLTYVSSEPPTLDVLLERMLQKGIRPQGRLLSLLMTHSKSLAEAMRYLNLSHPALVDCSTRSAANSADKAFWTCVLSLPLPTLTVYLEALARFPTEFMHLINSNPVGQLRPYVSPHFLAYTQRRFAPSRYDQRIVIHYLLLILTRRNNSSASAWFPLLIAFRTVFLFNLRGRHAGNALPFDAWHYLDLIQSSLRRADVCLGLRGFNELCIIWEAFALSGMRITEASADNSILYPRSYFGKAHRLKLQHKAEFERLVMPLSTFVFRSQYKRDKSWERSVAPKNSTRPMLLITPSYYTLHLLIQVLGAWNDEFGLMALLRWMRDYASDLDRGASESNSSPRQRRLAIIAMKVYLERLWDTENVLYEVDDPDYKELYPAPVKGSEHKERYRIAECQKHQTTAIHIVWAKNLVEAVKSWGGWPGDEEVQRYLDGQPKFDSLRAKYASLRHQSK